MSVYRGTVRKLGLEGGLWALVTDDGRQVELLDPPAELQRDGLRAEVHGTKRGAEVSVGMVGDTIVVKRFSAL
ncbi:MAG: hypothetical protein AAGH15_21245 [Myxococcota bacterium]